MLLKKSFIGTVTSFVNFKVKIGFDSHVYPDSTSLQKLASHASFQLLETRSRKLTCPFRSMTLNTNKSTNVNTRQSSHGNKISVSVDFLVDNLDSNISITSALQEQASVRTRNHKATTGKSEGKFVPGDTQNGSQQIISNFSKNKITMYGQSCF